MLLYDQYVTHNHYPAQRGAQAHNIKQKLNCSQAIAHANDVKAHTHTHTYTLFVSLESCVKACIMWYTYIPHSLQLFKCLLLIALIRHNLQDKLQVLVYDILPSATAVFSYAIGSRKLSANEQFFVGAQTVVSWLQTTQIKQGLSFIAVSKVYTSANKTTIVWIETELFFLFLPWVDASHVYVRALALGCFYSHISTGTLWRALTAWLDSCAEIKSAPSVA